MHKHLASYSSNDSTLVLPFPHSRSPEGLVAWSGEIPIKGLGNSMVTD